MHKSESVLENGINKIHWNFEIQMYYLIMARRSELVSISKRKRNLSSWGFCHSGKPVRENETK